MSNDGAGNDAGPDPLQNLVDQIDQEMVGVTPVEGERARVLREAATAGGEQHIIFTLAGTDYAFPIDNVLEVSRPPEFTPVPNVPPWVLGVTNLRGDILSLVDLRQFLELESTQHTPDTRMLVLYDKATQLTIGAFVDQVKGIRYFQTERITDPTAPIDTKIGELLRGIYDYEERVVGVFDCSRLLRSNEMRQFDG